MNHIGFLSEVIALSFARWGSSVLVRLDHIPLASAPREGYALFIGEKQVGTVCSGAVSPTKECNIGTSYFPLEVAIAGTEIEMDIRGKRQAATVCELPFYSRPKN